MSTHNLKNANFLLGVDEAWDSHIEVIVEFMEQVSINDHPYHIFNDKVTNKSFYLSPRYIGQKIEDIDVEKHIVVNVSKLDLDENQDKNRLPTTYATGLLEILSKVDS